VIQPGKLTGDRDTVLGRIRSAMATPTDPHVIHGGMSPDRSHIVNVLPPVADTWEAKLAALTERSANLKTNFIVVPDRGAMASAVRDLVDAEVATKVAYQRHPLVTPNAETVCDFCYCVDDGFDKAVLEQCEIGISTCFAVVAQTGSIAVTSHSTAGRALTVLPPHHIVLATADLVVPHLPAMWAKFAASPDRQGSMLSLISGPSRTGDIERILVLGAHGPKKLTLILEQPS